MASAPVSLPRTSTSLSREGNGATMPVQKNRQAQLPLSSNFPCFPPPNLCGLIGGHTSILLVHLLIVVTKR